MKNYLTKLSTQLDSVSRMTRKNAPTLLTAVGIIGFVSTVISAVKATPEAMKDLEEVKKDIPKDAKKSEIIWKETKAVAPHYIETAIIGTASMACFIKSNRMSVSRLAAVTTAYEVREKMDKELREAVAEKLGPKKEQEIYDDIAKKHVEEAPIENDDILSPSTGTQLFLDSLSGQYFRSTKDDIYQALIDFKNWLFLEDFATLNEWYNQIPAEGLKQIKIGDRLGFNSTQGIDIYWSVQLAPNNEPVTVLEYRTPPTYDFAIGKLSETW